MFELLTSILQGADDSLQEAQGYSLFPGEYMNDSPAPADVTDLTIEIDRCHTLESGLPGLCATVTTEPSEHCGGWIIYLEQSVLGGTFKPYYGNVTTLEGYCHPGCDCPFCDMIRQAA